ncbi:CDP-diacylglycerol--inositol 3-phosphatidyltransferase [Galemys pyrenaicus]|uniref:CDP-diacylglycerol--inositol 3-phosphatidyltransferase n=1 Tax=Galemys pyrenaicus TaxID=202257 RepID=A0A8J6A4E4_GALPY|nr:CDP-diacylglycerol--inositol 3-phosphatidyltransferase [Galemys pyrenaicus]
MPEENIFLFVPNLIGECCPRLRAKREGERPRIVSLIIPVSLPTHDPSHGPSQGYARILFAIISFYFMPCCPLTASSFYLLSGLLDAFDGYAARALNQGTRFGAMLDMLTDRCSTMCLLVNLALLYPRATLLFQLSMSLDVASHWLHLHSSVVRGSESHKMIDLSGNPVLRIYYTSRPALFTLCAGNELFYCLLYLFNFSEGPLVGSVGLFRMGLWITAPIALLKSLISVIHLVTAARNMAALDAADRSRKK